MSVINAADDEMVAGVTTGIDKLDEMLGPIRGLPIGRTTILTGEYSSGKTAAALTFLGEAQRAGFQCAFADIERTFSKEQAVACGVDLDFPLLRGAYGEEQLNEIEDFMYKNGKKGKPSFVVLDSYTALSPRAEVERDNEGKGMMEKSRLIAPHLRRLTNLVPETGSVYVIIGQHWEVKLPNGAIKFTLAGGDMMAKTPSVWLRLRTRAIQESGIRIGSEVIFTQMKNKVGGLQGAECEVRYLFSGGFQKQLGALERGLADGSIIREGNTFYLGKEKLGTISKARAALAAKASSPITEATKQTPPVESVIV